MSSNIGSRILEYLTNEKGSYASARIIADAINTPKHQVNAWLYSEGHKFGVVKYDKSVPPLWGVPLLARDEAKEPTESSRQAANIIFVDLGNVHDILPKLEDYANGTDLQVFAFADLAFSGYGVNPPPANKNIRVFHATSSHKNAADLEMVWMAAKLIMNDCDFDDQAEDMLRFFIFTKDLGFQSLKEILERYSRVKEVKFVQRWDEVRDYVE